MTSACDVTASLDVVTCLKFAAATQRYTGTCIAGWSSLVARRAHNPKVASSNLAPATKRSNKKMHVRAQGYPWALVLNRFVTFILDTYLDCPNCHE
jgi:hypothetical protein